MKRDRFSLRPRPWRQLKAAVVEAWAWVETIVAGLIGVLAIVRRGASR